MARSFASVWFPASMVFAASLGAAAVAGAQTSDAIGIRAQGMGGAFTAVADDATAAWWNPAGLASGAYFSAILEAGDDHHRGLSIAYPALGLSYYRHRINQIQPLDSTAAPSAGRQDPGTGDVRLRSLDVAQFGATVGQSIGAHLVMASTVKLVNGADTTRGDLDIGAMAAFGVARVGVTVRNVTQPTLGTGDDAVSLDRSARVGVALTTPRGRTAASATLAADADLTKVVGRGGEERRVAAGVEVWSGSRSISGRAGFSVSTVGEARTTASAGVSVAVRSGTYLDAQYSHMSAGDERKSVGLAVRVTF